MKLRIIPALLALSLGIYSNGAHADETVALKAGYMLMSPSGTFGVTANNLGTNIDMKQDLNFDNSANVTAELTINLGNTGISFAYMPLSFSGAGVLPRNITFNGQNYAANTTVSSELQADVFDFGYTYYLVNMDDLPSRFQLGIETAVKTIQAKASMTSAGLTTAKNITVPIPTMGLRGRVALADFVGIAARVGYLGYAGNSFTDFDAQVEFSPLPTMGIYGGYRYIKLKIDTNGVLADTSFKGPYAGGFIRF